jgi:hemoglobin/transferrin/lactoferrin receptor protein
MQNFLYNKAIIYYITFILFLGLSVGKSHAQSLQIKDRASWQGIGAVFITTADGQKSVATNSKGVADLSAFSDSDQLTVRHLSYKEVATTKVQLAADGYVLYLDERVVNLNELVFSANKAEEMRNDLANKIEVVDKRTIAFNNPQTSGDLLAQTGNVFVQSSQMGGSSPVLRGFEASRVLLVVDGVRMNNAIYRSGHLQNVITLDPAALDRVEVLFGPGSVMYGSDALGGVMHFYTRKPEFSGNGQALVTGNGLLRYSSANNERTGAATVNFGLKKWAFLTSLSYKDLGDLRAGSVRSDEFPEFGKRTFYVQRIGNKDSVFKNSDVSLQRGSGYTQYDLMQKVAFRPSERALYTLNVQYSNSSDVPRYDRLTDTRNGLPRFAEWYYGPQTRLLGALRGEWQREKGLFDRAAVTAAYQYISEDRVTRDFNRPLRTSREETVQVYSLNADLQKTWKNRYELRYGAEFTYNDVGSVAYNTNVTTGAQTPASTRYPDGGSQQLNAALYATHNWEISEQLIFSQGIRLSHVRLDASFQDKTFYKFPFDKAEQRNTALNGQLGLVWKPDRTWRIAINTASGFRSLNVDDLGKVFDTNTAAKTVVVPNPDLKPEYTYNGELTVSKTLFEHLTIEATGFYTLFRQAIAVRNAQFNGQDFIMYDGVLSRVQANINANSAYVAGFQLNMQAQLSNVFSLQSNLTYTKGQVTSDNVPLDHIPPMFGQTILRANVKKWRSEFFVRYSGAKKLADYSPSGEDNLQYATTQGMLSWYTLNLRTAYAVHKNLQLQLALENLLDTHYRVFASGISAPGRNLVIAVRGNF